MKKYGGNMVYKLGIGSDDQDKIVDYFNKWKEDIWPTLRQEFGSGKMEIEIGEINLESEDLDDTPKTLPFEGIISSFHKEKSFKSQKPEGKYQFKAKNFLSFDTMRIGKFFFKIFFQLMLQN